MFCIVQVKTDSKHKLLHNIPGKVPVRPDDRAYRWYNVQYNLTTMWCLPYRGFSFRMENVLFSENTKRDRAYNLQTGTDKCIRMSWLPILQKHVWSLRNEFASLVTELKPWQSGEKKNTDTWDHSPDRAKDLKILHRGCRKLTARNEKQTFEKPMKMIKTGP